MLHAHKVYGFAADAALYCPNCAVERYGTELLFVDCDVRDWEGNEITPLYSWTVDAAEDYCDDCFRPLVDG